MNRDSLLNSLIFFIYSFFAIFNFAFAQEVTVRQFPDTPKEGEEVKLTLESDKYNLNIANISWKVDGTEVDSGVGRKSLVLKTSSNGIAQVVVATIDQDGYNQAQIQKVVEANTNFILYEGADSYVPLFYKGRRLPAKEGLVSAAFFSFKDGEISGLGNGVNNYSWKINSQDRPELSGPNKITNKMLSKVTDSSMNLQIMKEDSTQSRKISQINIPLQSTEVVIYKTDQKKLLRQVLGDTETGKSIYLLVEPFFFSVPDKRSQILTYSWKINDIEYPVPTPWSVVFSGKDQDSVKVNLDIVNNQKITQENSRGFTFKVQ